MKVYWNNICLISRYEKEHIEETLESKALEEYQFTYFGLGKETEAYQSITDDLKKESLPDVIISTDCDVFRKEEALKGRQSLLLNRDPWEREEGDQIIGYEQSFFPMLYIPLVFVVDEKRVKEKPTSFKDLIEKEEFEGQISFGGLDNSAGKMLLQTISALYGAQAANRLLERSQITNMPVGAFKNVVEGRAKVAIVPTIFAMQAGTRNLSFVWPKEGAPVIPSFVVINKEAHPDKVDVLFNEVITSRFIQKIVKQTGVIPCIKGIEMVPMFKAYRNQIIYPDWDTEVYNIENKRQERKAI